ncbi:MAG: hypothetical protein DRP67_04835 [Candidatus Omnitrophota bacterium]|nr:MAG: hypothetical protein DRP67_04835 [Candidatus Omnitrophota bacterium]
MRIGFIGCGWIGNEHMKRVSKIEGVEISCICDIDGDKAKIACEKYGGKPYTDYRKMLDEVEIDACYICVPPFAHKDQEILCIEKNIPFFVEKPVHIDLEKAKEIAEKIEERKLITCVGYQDRYQRIIEYIKPFFKENNLGFFTGWWVNGIPQAWWWRKKELSGGQIVEQTTHIFDMARYLVGEPVEVFAVKRKGIVKMEGYNIEDASGVSIYFENGVFGIIFSGCFMKNAGKAGLDFYFSDKIIEYQERRSVKINYGNKIEEIYETEDLIMAEDKSFIEAIKKKDPSLIKSSYKDGVKTLAFTIAANKSMESGKVEKVRV